MNMLLRNITVMSLERKPFDDVIDIPGFKVPYIILVRELTGVHNGTHI